MYSSPQPSSPAPSTVQPNPEEVGPAALNQAAAQPEIATEPSAGLPGSEFRITGTDYPANYMVRISMYSAELSTEHTGLHLPE
jgi:hypothetical protein